MPLTLLRCIDDKLHSYVDDLSDRADCNCLNDCEMVHFFATMVRESYHESKDASRKKWFDSASSSGLLANYLLDPKYVFVDKLSKTMLALSRDTTDASSDYSSVAEDRFRSDIAVLNFFFDTPIITQINLELKTTVFDQISSVGGTLGLFTGVSVITFIELVYWGCVAAGEAIKRSGACVGSRWGDRGQQGEQLYSMPFVHSKNMNAHEWTRNFGTYYHDVLRFPKSNQVSLGNWN